MGGFYNLYIKQTLMLDVCANFGGFWFAYDCSFYFFSSTYYLKSCLLDKKLKLKKWCQKQKKIFKKIGSWFLDFHIKVFFHEQT